MRLVKFLSSLYTYRHFYYLKYRYRSYPRFKEATIKLFGKTIKIPDMASFLATYEEIFIRGIYTFKSNNTEPIIFDVGANIGLSVIFFKSIHPNARIVALEPDKHIFNYLKNNVESFGLKNVELINAAAWIANTKLNFTSDGADGGTIGSSSAKSTIEVDALDVGSLLDRYPKIDFLKMDIEGAEEVVFPHCEKFLPRVEKAFIEYHSKHDSPQRLSDILEILQINNFRYHLHPVLVSEQPFVQLDVYMNFDNQLNIFAWR